MPISKRFVCGDATLLVWAINEPSEQLGAMLGNEALLQQARAFGSEARRAEWLAVRLLLRDLLGNDAGIEYDADGKPLLAGVDGYISVAHTRGYAAVAYSPKYPLGVDIELITRKVGVARDFLLNKGEQALLPAAGGDGYLLLRWTAYEALYKLVGGVDYKNRLDMPLFTPVERGVCSVSLADDDSHLLPFVISYLRDKDLLVTLALPGDDCSLLVLQ